MGNQVTNKDRAVTKSSNCLSLPTTADIPGIPAIPGQAGDVLALKVEAQGRTYVESIFPSRTFERGGFAYIIKTYLFALLFLLSGATNSHAIVKDLSDWKWRELIRVTDLAALQSIKSHWGMNWDFDANLETGLNGVYIEGIWLKEVYDELGDEIIGYELKTKGNVLGLTIHISDPDYQDSINPLNKSIPSAIGALANLTRLEITGRPAFAEDFGSIPLAIGNLTELDYLKLYGIGLKGSIPSPLGKLAKLSELHLEGNFTGSIPREIGNLTNLKAFVLSGGFVAGNEAISSGPGLSGGIPVEIGNLVNLGSLSISATSLGGKIPKEIGNLVNLRGLTLEHCKLSGSIPKEIGNLQNLETFSFRNNFLSGRIPPEIGNMKNLGLILLDYNNLSGSIPVELVNMPNLEGLLVSENGLSGEIPSGLNIGLDVENNYFDISEGSSFLEDMELLELEGQFVDYRPQKGLAISLHQLKNNAVSNLDEGLTDSDAPIKVKPDPSILANQPEIASGLVADGVTPLLLKIRKTQDISLATDFRIRVASVSGNHVTSEISSKLSLLINGNFVPYDFINNELNINPDDEMPVAYICLGAIDPDFILSSVDTTEVVVEIGFQQLQSTGSPAGQEIIKRIRIRKPPIALVHGYNTVGEWGDNEFKDILRQDRADDFVREIRYGVANIGRDGEGKLVGDSTGNTYQSLAACAFSLSTQLKLEIERWDSDLRNDWAFTRYDAVGHSQGGILLRMLSSAKQNAGVPAFRHHDNMNRGRFRRIVTIGSPHNGSRLVRYLQKLANKPGLFSAIPTVLSPDSPIGTLIGKAGTLQGKFDPWGSEIRDLNAPGGSWTPDPAAKFLMIRTTVNNGLPPGEGNLVSLLAYSAVGLTLSGGTAVLPNGSDGVVDLDSQGNVVGSSANVYTAPTSMEISHSGPLVLFAADHNQTHSVHLAHKVQLALSDLDDTLVFGRFNVPPLLQPGVRDAIDEAALQTVFLSNIIGPGIVFGGGNFSYPVVTFPGSIPPLNLQSEYFFSLNPPPGHEVSGKVQWTAQVFGLGGVSNVGLTVTVNPADSRQVSVSVDSSVLGDVVLYANYALLDGGVAFADPVKVVSISPPDAVLNSIDLEPAGSTLPVGSSVILHLWANYSDGKRLLVYPDPASVAFSSSDPLIGVVSTEGILSMKAQGTVTVNASYSNQTAQGMFTVTPGIAPVVSTSSDLVAMLGQSFQYQISGTNLPTNFGASGLPSGLEIDADTGIISGVPTVLGNFIVSVEAANSVGIGSSNLVLSVRSQSLAPLDEWRQTHFSTIANEGSAADLADPDLDGVANIVEFAFGLNPHGQSAHLLPQWHFANNNLSITFTKPSNVSGLTYGAEWSGNMAPGTWLPLNNTGTSPQYIFTLPVSGANKFVRLKIISP